MDATTSLRKRQLCLRTNWAPQESPPGDSLPLPPLVSPRHVGGISPAILPEGLTVLLLFVAALAQRKGGRDLFPSSCGPLDNRGGTVYALLVSAHRPGVLSKVQKRLTFLPCEGAIPMETLTLTVAFSQVPTCLSNLTKFPFAF